MSFLLNLFGSKKDEPQSVGAGNSTEVPQKMGSSEYDPKKGINFKVTFVGDSGNSAKTSFILRYVNNEFENYSSIEAHSNYVKNITVREKKVRLQIWDTPGQERFESIISALINGAVGIVVGYGITCRASYECARQRFIDLKRKYPDTVIMLIGSKADLEEYRKVSQEEGDELAEELGIPLFFEGK